MQFPSKDNPYVMEAENVAEMARLINQGRLTTKGMGGLFPEHSDVSHIRDILDISCGPGEWVLHVASTYPQIRAIGIDISDMMIQYALSQARTLGLTDVEFRRMDALERLGFSDHSFDLVNARLLIGFMAKTAWPRLMQECMRVTRPGGVIRLTEGDDMGTTTSPAHERLKRMVARAFQLAGRSFSSDGQQFSITPLLGHFLREAGCINVRYRGHALEFSAGTEAYESWYQNCMAGFKLIQPFLLKMGVTTQEEVDTLYERMLVEMRAEDFCGVWQYLTAWGEKPK